MQQHGCNHGFKGEEILDAGLSCQLLSKVTDLTGIKCRTATSHVLVLDTESTNAHSSPFDFILPWFFSQSILDQAQVNL